MISAAMRHPRLPSWPHRLVALAGILLVLGLDVLSASPQLHEWLHHDADQPGHECAITLFHHGLVGVEVAIDLVVAPMQWFWRLETLPSEANLISFPFRLLHVRAPPER